MRFSHRLFYCCVAWLLAVDRSQAAEAPPWAHELSEIKPDARVVWGKLENGLRYAILPNSNPKGRVYLQLYLAAGSIHEREDERGLAHFVEHMAFKGTTHFRKNELIEYTQRHGMSFGGDTNAHTAYDHTLYKLALADNDPAEWKAALLILRDWAGGVTFDPAEFEAERGVIESERRLRDDATSRLYEQKRERWLAGTGYAGRAPIGDSGVILRAPLEKLREFYDAWYQPERMVVLVVGDIKPTEVETSLREQFRDLAGRGPGREQSPMGRPRATGAVGLALGDPELPSGSFVSLDSVSLVEPGPDTAERRQQDLRLELGLAMFRRRLAEFAEKQGYNFSNPILRMGESFAPFRIVELGASGSAWRWNENLGILEQQLRAALQFGFTSSELNVITAPRMIAVEQRAATWRTLSSGALVAELLASIRERRVFSEPAERLESLRDILQQVAPEECTAAFRAAWEGGNRFVGAMGSGFTPSKAPAILAAYESSQRTAVQAPREISAREFAYSDFGPAGKIEKQEHDAALDFYRVTFANGIRLNVKRTTFRKNRVDVSLRFEGGQLAQPKENPGLVRFFGAWALGGLLKHTPAELRDLNSAHAVGFAASTDLENFGWRVSTRAQDLRYALELGTAYFSEPAFDKNEWRKVWSEQLSKRSAWLRSLDGVSELRISPLLAKDDGRLMMPGLIGSFFTGRSTFIEWFQPILKTSPMEIAIVGDVDPLKAIEEVARTFGTLPNRRRERSAVDGEPLQAEEKPLERTLTYRNSASRALTTLAWRQTRSGEYPERQKLVVLAEILQGRVFKKVRSEMGSAYSPSAELTLSEHSPNYAFLICKAETAPERTAEAQAAIKEIARALAEHGVTEEELERARAPLLAAQLSEVRTNGYWLDLLGEAQSNPKRFQWWQERTSRLKALTKADLDEAARNYLRADRLSVFTIQPTNAVSGAQAVAR